MIFIYHYNGRCFGEELAPLKTYWFWTLRWWRDGQEIHCELA